VDHGFRAVWVGFVVAGQVLIDELIVSGNATAVRAGLDRWYAASAEMPVVVLPSEPEPRQLDHVLDVLRST
jgi:hypothetical protein